MQRRQQVTRPRARTPTPRTAGGWMLVGMSPDGLEDHAGRPVGGARRRSRSSTTWRFRSTCRTCPIPMQQQAIAHDAHDAGRACRRRRTKPTTNSRPGSRCMSTQIERTQADDATRLDQIHLRPLDRRRRAARRISTSATPPSRARRWPRKSPSDSNVTTNFAGFIQPDAACDARLRRQGDRAPTRRSSTQMIVDQFSRQGVGGDRRGKTKDEQRRPGHARRSASSSTPLQTTLKAGTIDGGAVLHAGAGRPHRSSPADFVTDPAKIESGLQEAGRGPGQRRQATSCRRSIGPPRRTTTSPSTPMQVPDQDDERSQGQLFGDKLDMVVGIGAAVRRTSRGVATPATRSRR